MPAESDSPVVADKDDRKSGRTSLSDGASLEKLQQLWPALLVRIGHAVPFIKPYLNDACPAEIDAERVVIVFDSEFAGDIERIGDLRNRQRIGRLIGNALGVGMLNVVLRAAEPGEWKNLAGKIPVARSEEEKEEDAEPKSGRRAAQDWYNDETARMVLDLFEGEIDDVRE